MRKVDRSSDALASASLAELLDRFEEDFERLRVAYEKYFVGVDRVPPTKLEKDLDRLLHRILAERPTKTSLRFRTHSVKSRLVTYRHYWTRILGEMERGVYRRDVLRAERRSERAVAEQALDGNAAKASVDGARSSEPAADSDPEADRRASPSRAGIPEPLADHGSIDGVTGYPNEELRRLFRDYVQAKKAAGESVEGLNYGALVRRVRDELPKLQERARGAEVRFVVTTEGGRVRLRAERRKGEP